MPCSVRPSEADFAASGMPSPLRVVPAASRATVAPVPIDVRVIPVSTVVASRNAQGSSGWFNVTDIVAPTVFSVAAAHAADHDADGGGACAADYYNPMKFGAASPSKPQVISEEGEDEYGVQTFAL